MELRCATGKVVPLPRGIEVSVGRTETAFQCWSHVSRKQVGFELLAAGVVRVRPSGSNAVRLRSTSDATWQRLHAGEQRYVGAGAKIYLHEKPSRSSRRRSSS